MDVAKKYPCEACGARECLTKTQLCDECLELSQRGIRELETEVRSYRPVQEKRLAIHWWEREAEQEAIDDLNHTLRATAVIAWIDRRSRAAEGLPVRRGHISNLVAGDAIFRRLTGRKI